MSARAPADDALLTDDGAGKALAMDWPASLADGSLLAIFRGGAMAAFGFGVLLS